MGSTDETLKWMATDEFRQIHEVYESVAGPGRIYFRATAAGVVMIPLVDEAPKYLGFRTHDGDARYLLRVGSSAPKREEVAQRWREFPTWARTKAPKEEERCVIPWIRAALQNQLRLSDIGRGSDLDDTWFFLNQERRFTKGEKTDVQAVHWPSGRLGIIEFKDAREKRLEGLQELEDYAKYWKRDRTDLVPLFTAMLRVNGQLYGNSSAMKMTVSADNAALFFGVAYPGFVSIEPVDPSIE
jgi:hypothetical protein